MEAVNIQFAPATGTDQEWNEAYARLADFFRSYRLHNRIRRTQLVLESLRRASEAHAKNPTRKKQRCGSGVYSCYRLPRSRSATAATMRRR